jgi:hypothetical protein
MHRVAHSIAAIGLAFAAQSAMADTPRLPLSLVTQTDLASRDNRAREPFYFQVSQALVASGRVIVPAGSIAVGEIVTVGRSDRFARKGEMAVRLLYVSAPGGRMKLATAEGNAGLVASRGLMHPAAGRVRVGTPVMAYLAEQPEGGQAALAVAVR